MKCFEQSAVTHNIKIRSFEIEDKRSFEKSQIWKILCVEIKSFRLLITSNGYLKKKKERKEKEGKEKEKKRKEKKRKEKKRKEKKRKEKKRKEKKRKEKLKCTRILNIHDCTY